MRLLQVTGEMGGLSDLPFSGFEMKCLGLPKVGGCQVPVHRMTPHQGPRAGKREAAAERQRFALFNPSA